MVYCFRVSIMPRIARKKSISNIYHVMVRGINRQNIFEDDDDRLCFMKILNHCKEISGFRLHAFVLMSNHIHLLIEPAGEPLNTVFTRIETRYAMRYNRKYQRIGYLFQNRYRSENVETEQYYKTVLRYIIQNPMKAGIESHPGTYRWSSYLAYEKGSGAITDTQYALELFGSRENMLEFLSLNNDDAVMDDVDFDQRLQDEQIQEMMYRISKCESAAAFQALDSQLRKKYAEKMYQSGASLSQIARITGMPKTTVFRIIQKLKDEEAESEEENAVFRESDLTDHFLYDEIVW